MLRRTKRKAYLQALVVALEPPGKTLQGEPTTIHKIKHWLGIPNVSLTKGLCITRCIVLYHKRCRKIHLIVNTITGLDETMFEYLALCPSMQLLSLTKLASIEPDVVHLSDSSVLSYILEKTINSALI